MKKIYLLFAMLLGLGTSLWAQTSSEYEIIEDEPLIKDVSKLSSPYTDPEEGSLEAMLDGDVTTFWHSNWHGGAVAPGTHYFQVEMPEGEYDLISFVYKRRPNASNQTTEWSVYGTDDPDAVKDDCDLLAEVSTPFGAQNESFTSKPFNPKSYKYLRFYSEETDGSQKQQGFFHVGEFQLYPVQKADEYEAAMKALEDLYMSLKGTEFNTGTEPGQYSAEAVQVFQDVLQEVFLACEPGSSPTLEEAKDLTKRLQDAYDAILASIVPITLPDGYYRIRTGMKYTNDDQEVDKYMYSYWEGKVIKGGWGTPEDVAIDCPSLWQITNKDGYFDIVNMATESRFDNITALLTPVTMSAESENLMALDAVANVEGIIYVNIRVSTNEKGEFVYLHQNNHGGGTGKGSTLVVWEPTFDTEANAPRASEWVIEPVSDEDAAQIIADYAPIREHELLLIQYKELKDEATAAIEAAKDVQTVELITDVSQLSSPWTDPEQGSLANLLDNSNTTFWHSSWHDNPPHDIQGSHYLQVELPEGYYQEGLEIKVAFSRRSGAGSDHITTLSIRGTDEGEDADPYTDPMSIKDGLTELLSFNCPYGNSNESFTTESFDPQGWKYLRLYADATTNDRVYWHISELSAFFLQENPNSQYSKMGQVAIDLDNLLQEQASIEDADVDNTIYQALFDAYEAFKGEFVDPAELRAVIDSVKNMPAIVVVGEGIGYWPDNSTATALQTVIDDATAYDVAGVYTATVSKAYIADLREKAAAIPAAAKRIQTGKWYRFRFPSEEMFDTYGWDKTPGAGTPIDENTWKVEPLFNKIAAISVFESISGNEVHYKPEDLEKVTLGQEMFFVNEDEDNIEDLDDPKAALFQFVAVGDTAFVLQNKATGMYLKAAGTSGVVTLNIHPSLFNVEPIGYGLNLIKARNLNGDNQNCLHGQKTGNKLVTWGATNVGSASALLIEEVQDVAEDYNKTDFNFNLQLGSINGFCYPVTVKSKSKDAVIYGVNAVAGNTITLVPLKEEVAAGRPFICIYGDTEDYDKEYEGEPVSFTHGTEFVAKASDEGTLKGTWATKTVGAGVLLTNGNAFVISKSKLTEVNANSAWITSTEGFDTEAEVTIVIDDKGQDGIAAALTNVAKTGELYTIDGRLISRKANLNTLRTLGRGVYILNGTKVTVK